MNSSLIKVLFIVANAYATQLSVQSPTPPPKPKEQEQYMKRKETSELLSHIMWLIVPLFWATNAIFASCDIYMVLSAVYPSVHISLLHSLLLPSPAETPSAADFYLSRPFVLSSLLLYAATYLRYVCYQTLGRQFTFELALKEEHKLITVGPYSIVRHPSYLGMAICLPSMAVAQLFSPGTWWVESAMWHTWQGQAFGVYWVSFVVYVCWALLARVPKEDLMLRTEFKEQWLSWSQKTPYAVIPYVW